jgi:hypothetical protein
MPLKFWDEAFSTTVYLINRLPSKVGLSAFMIEADPVFGKVIANYPSDRIRLIAPAVVISGVVSVILNVTLAEVEGWWGPALTVIIMASVVLGLGWRVLHFWNHEVVLYEEGFSYREGARPVFFLYHEIMSVRQQGQRLAYFGGLIRRNTYQFTLTTLRGEVMKLDNKTPLTNYRIKSRQYVKWKQCWFIGVNSDGHAKTSMEPIDL